MEALDTVLLFGKYQLCRILGAGRFGTVFLAVHIGLMENRAIKRVPKSSLDYEHFRREALILKELRHPGIPIVYDIEEDESYSYLIEEYLEGESFFDLVKRQGHLSGELTCFYGIQLARIVHYLHSAGEYPILHLDLQPKNLLLCHDTVKLIDFGQADYAPKASHFEKRYGTPGCAAPEQYDRDGQLDPRTDIFAIGVVLHFLYTGGWPLLPYAAPYFMDKKLAGIISDCLQAELSRRISSAKELEVRLQLSGCTGTELPGSSSSLIIAFAGSKPGAGTTHVAAGLSVYLKHHGFPNLYEEKNSSGMGMALGEYTHASKDSYGLMRYEGFVWKPRYGDGVSLKASSYNLHILDYGTDVQQAYQDGADGLVLVCDGQIWSQRAARKMAECAEADPNADAPKVAVYNHVAAFAKIMPSFEVCSCACLKAPMLQSPFGSNGKSDAKSDDFYLELVRQLVKAGMLRRMDPEDELLKGLTKLVASGKERLWEKCPFWPILKNIVALQAGKKGGVHRSQSPGP